MGAVPLTSISYEAVKPTSASGQDQDKVEIYGSFTGSASYSTGGEALALADIGLSALDYISFEDYDVANVVYVLRYDRTNAKVVIENDRAGTEETAATDLSAKTYRFHAKGTALVRSGA